MTSVTVVGGSGYAGGELLRLLLRHPDVDIASVTSDSLAGQPVHRAHPNLRRVTDLEFVAHGQAAPADVLVACTPHGESMRRIDAWFQLAPRVLDLSADFRLRDPAAYPHWYGYPHARPELLEEAVYGIAELHRERIRGARLVAGAGCVATAGILALLPLTRAGLVDPRHMVVDAKVGSSAAGTELSPASLHAERAGAVRAYAATQHRHTAELEQELARGGERPTVALSCHAVEMVRGVSVTAHAFTDRDLSDRDLWRVYRDAYGGEPFIRLVKEARGAHRYPEPKFVLGTNYCDVGFEWDPHARRIVAIAALDNLARGSASAAVQNMNLMLGLDEAKGLDDVGFHPV